jgi:hypothetical protein
MGPQKKRRGFTTEDAESAEKTEEERRAHPGREFHPRVCVPRVGMNRIPLLQ